MSGRSRDARAGDIKIGSNWWPFKVWRNLFSGRCLLRQFSHWTDTKPIILFRLSSMQYLRPEIVRLNWWWNKNFLPFQKFIRSEMAATEKQALLLSPTQNPRRCRRCSEVDETTPVSWSKNHRTKSNNFLSFNWAIKFNNTTLTHPNP